MTAIVREGDAGQCQRRAAEAINTRATVGRGDRRIRDARRAAVQHRAAKGVIAERDVIEGRRQRVYRNSTALVIAVAAVLIVAYETLLCGPVVVGPNQSPCQ